MLSIIKHNVLTGKCFDGAGVLHNSNCDTLVKGKTLTRTTFSHAMIFSYTAAVNQKAKSFIKSVRHSMNHRLVLLLQTWVLWKLSVRNFACCEAETLFPTPVGSLE